MMGKTSSPGNNITIHYFSIGVAFIAKWSPTSKARMQDALHRVHQGTGHSRLDSNRWPSLGLRGAMKKVVGGQECHGERGVCRQTSQFLSLIFDWLMLVP
jgi:hypothetical protein